MPLYPFLFSWDGSPTKIDKPGKKGILSFLLEDLATKMASFGSAGQKPASKRLAVICHRGIQHTTKPPKINRITMLCTAVSQQKEGGLPILRGHDSLPDVRRTVPRASGWQRSIWTISWLTSSYESELR